MLGASAFTPRARGLEIKRLLGPERAVVVEGGDRLGGRDEVGRALSGDLLHEADDCSPLVGPSFQDGKGFLLLGLCPKDEGEGRSKGGERGASLRDGAVGEHPGILDALGDEGHEAKGLGGPAGELGLNLRIVQAGVEHRPHLETRAMSVAVITAEQQRSDEDRRSRSDHISTVARSG